MINLTPLPTSSISSNQLSMWSSCPAFCFEIGLAECSTQSRNLSQNASGREPWSIFLHVKEVDPLISFAMISAGSHGCEVTDGPSRGHPFFEELFRKDIGLLCIIYQGGDLLFRKASNSFLKRSMFLCEVILFPP